MAVGDRLFLSNQANKGGTPDPQTNAKVCTIGTAGDITSSPGPYVISAPVTGRISNITISNVQNGADGTDPLSITIACTVNGTSIFGTAPILAKAAGTGHKSSAQSGTGITQAVVAAGSVTVGDSVLITPALTRTTPETEMNGFSVAVSFIEQQNFNPNS